MLASSVALLSACALQASQATYLATIYSEARNYWTKLGAATVLDTQLELDPMLVIKYQSGTPTPADAPADGGGSTDQPATPAAPPSAAPAVAAPADAPAATVVFDLGGAYYPRLLVDVTTGLVYVLNQLTIAGAFRPSPLWTLFLTEDLSYGTTDLRTVTTAPGGVVQPIPFVATLKYIYEKTAAGFEIRPSARVSLVTTLAYTIQGGADAVSRVSLPLQNGPSATFAASVTATREDTFTTVGTASFSTFDPGTKVWVATLLEAWDRALGPQTRLRLGAGMGASGNPGVTYGNPVAEAGLMFGIGRPASPSRNELVGLGAPRYWPTLPLGSLMIGGGARLGPFVDQVTGYAYERFDAFAALGWAPHPLWRFSADVSGGTSLTGVQRGQVNGAGDAVASWEAARGFLLSAGVRLYWTQSGPDFPQPTYTQWTAFIGLAYMQRGRL